MHAECLHSYTHTHSLSLKQQLTESFYAQHPIHMKQLKWNMHLKDSEVCIMSRYMSSHEIAYNSLTAAFLTIFAFLNEI